jgi:hypothetical protein
VCAVANDTNGPTEITSDEPCPFFVSSRNRYALFPVVQGTTVDVEKFF